MVQGTKEPRKQTRTKITNLRGRITTFPSLQLLHAGEEDPPTLLVMSVALELDHYVRHGVRQPLGLISLYHCTNFGLLGFLVENEDVDRKM